MCCAWQCGSCSAAFTAAHAPFLSVALSRGVVLLAFPDSSVCGGRRAPLQLLNQRDRRHPTSLENCRRSCFPAIQLRPIVASCGCQAGGYQRGKSPALPSTKLVGRSSDGCNSPQGRTDRCAGRAPRPQANQRRGATQGPRSEPPALAPAVQRGDARDGHAHVLSASLRRSDLKRTGCRTIFRSARSSAGRPGRAISVASKGKMRQLV